MRDSIPATSSKQNKEMKEPTNEQIKEFWEWCGFTYIMNYDDPSVIEGSRSPTGERLNPPIDLNSLFEYAVPRVCFGVDLEMCPNDKWRAGIKLISDGIKYAKGDTPALALFWAIYEVIK